jgi:prepilin signal peptidase PulO-like enzyme (type II secretory pathway)
MMGALFGWKAIPAIVLLASVAGILISVPVLVLRRRRVGVAEPAAPPAPAPQPGPQAPAAPVSIRRTEVPFGPFLAASALCYLFLGKLAWATLMRLLIAE